MQANAIKMALQAKEVPASVYVAMRYWHPFTEEAVHQVIHENEVNCGFVSLANSEMFHQIFLVMDIFIPWSFVKSI